ncbi:MAG: glutamine synthetase [Clostridia bacterium]
MEKRFFLEENLLYTIPKEKYNKDDLSKIFEEHKEIKFISFVGIDLWGNDTDEKIPVKYFLDNFDSMMNNGIQTDGSSVSLSSLATLSDARVDLIPDRNSTWCIDYNYENIDEITKLPVGTLRIWSFLMHNGTYIDSRNILCSSLEKFSNYMLEKINNTGYYNKLGIKDFSEIKDIKLMLGTELEFWVRTPYDAINIDKLVLSQTLKEQYWKRTQGVVRTALEKSIEILNLYGFNVEMGHKEVGGVNNYISFDGAVENHIVEQLEVDWKYDEALKSADKEIIARILIKEIFRLYGLEVSFNAKPIIGVAGNGKHCHLSIILELKNGKKINLLTPIESNAFLSNIGWGVLMGVIQNYSLINPFVSNTNDSLNRLTPNYEAPTHIVASIGQNANVETRNRTVLAGLVKDLANPLSTRIELRAPNPKTNLYLTISATLATFIDGINYSLDNITNLELEKEFCKEYHEKGRYLSTNRVYREEKDIFKTYTADERDKLFGTPPKTVYETLLPLKEKTDILETLISKDIINAHIDLSITNWILDLKQRIIPEAKETVISYIELDNTNQYDKQLWKKIYDLKISLIKDDINKPSIFTEIIEACDNMNLEKISSLQQQLNNILIELKSLYSIYISNML